MSHQQGQCLCGEVSFNAATVDVHVGACHCRMCRKWGGAPYLSVDCGTDIKFEGQQHIGVFASSQWAERGFCKLCGTHLFYRLKGKQQYFVPVGLFDDNQQWQFDHQIFIDEKPAYYDFANQTENLTGAEAFAQFENNE
jgi:hypothetical protein